MFEERRRRRAIERVQPGDGRPLTPFRRRQLLLRSLFHVELLDDDVAHVWSVDVRHWRSLTTDDGKGTAELYRDGRQHSRSTLPAVFPVAGGVIEVEASEFGLQRCHVVAADGAERELTPDPASAEGRRARYERDHPRASRLVGAASVAMLVVPVLLLLLQVAEPVSQIPPIAEHVGVFSSPVDLQWWANVGLTVCAIVASTERATRLRHHWLLDSVG